MGGAVEELLGETLLYTAGSGPNRDCRPWGGPRRSCSALRDWATLPRTRQELLAASGPRKLRAGAAAELPSQGANGSGLERSRWLRVDRRSSAI